MRSLTRLALLSNQSGLGQDFDDAAILQTEIEGVNARRLHTEGRKGSTDLAAMIASVVEGPGEADTHRRVSLVPVSRVDLSDDGSGVEVTRQETRPRFPIALHHGRQLGKAHLVCVDQECAFTVEDEEVEGVAGHYVAHRAENGAVGAGDGRGELLRGQLEARIKQAQRRPNVVSEGIVQQRSGHCATVAHPGGTEKKAAI